MVIWRYEVVRYAVTKNGHCPVCGRRVRRSRTFEQTLNPFNKNADGTIKARFEVWRELLVSADDWAPDFTHAACKGGVLMSADTLRRAAALMRGRAQAAGFTAPSPWWVDGSEVTSGDQEPIEPLSVATSGMHWQEAHAIRAHVASWHPDVALAVAAWLEWEADESERFQAQTLARRQMVPRRALAVARAYLGEA